MAKNKGKGKGKGKKGSAVISKADVAAAEAAAKYGGLKEMTPSQLARARKEARKAGIATPRKSPMKGKHHSAEAKKKISAAGKKRYAGYTWRSPKAAWKWTGKDDKNKLPLAVLKSRRDRLTAIISERAKG